MLHRRQVLTLAAAAAAFTALPGVARVALAQAGSDRAVTFVKTTGDKLVGVVNGPGSAAEKRQALTQIIDQAVDVDGVGRFCLGRFWRTATPDQQKRYLALFHQVLVTSITAKLGEYQGVRFTISRSRSQDEDELVSTVVERPNNPPTNVDWVIANPNNAPKIIDVIAEGTSLRLTQRSDYASFLAHNNSSVDALISAMQQQIASAG
ncbi:MAG: ABC transporter substrate-binding protein [Rhodospirillales bacterium]|nr:ABC transporter substrate-binding protein [Rhodospirillales bacterium]